MSKLLIVSNSHAEALKRAYDLGLDRTDVSIITSLQKMRGHKDMLALYAGEPYLLDDFYEIIDYMASHGIKVLKWSSPNDTQAA
jgi:MoaA/NifB/PqqE/SkfB family radical SAM enzyme